MSKQTAVEWLMNEIDMQFPSINIRRKEWMLDQAKAVEREQHEDTWLNSRIESNDEDYIGKEKSFEQYYEQTYGGKHD